MHLDLPTLLRIAGFLQWTVLIASALVPLRLNWKVTLAPLPKLVRQLFWTYGGYVVLAIIFNGLVCVAAPHDLATTALGRIVCGYIATFWTVRLMLQWVFDAKPFLTHWILYVGDSLLTVIFATLSITFIAATLRLF